MKYSLQTHCRHCSNKLYEKGTNYRSCLFCKFQISKSAIRDFILSESYYDSKLNLFLSESKYGSAIYEPQFTDLKTLDHSYNDIILYVSFKCFKSLNFHRNRLRSLVKTIILK